MKLSALKSMKALEKRIDDMRELIIRLLSTREQMTAQINSMPPVPNRNTSKLENQTDRIFDLIEKVNALSNEYADIYCDYQMLLSDLTTKEQEVLHARYITGLPWKKVARVTNYSYSNPYKVQQRLIKDGRIEI